MSIIIFSGTSEGHALCGRLSARGVSAEVYVATDYGRDVMEPMPGINVHTGRLDEPAMEQLLTNESVVVDATHPYASAVSRNIKTACKKAGSRYLRLLRPSTEIRGAVHVETAAEAAAFLNTVEGGALLTVGSKELAAFTAVQDFASRLTVRVLPAQESLEHCLSLGFAAKQLILMQGPFSAELNAAMLRACGAGWLVTKDTGAAGGLPEKLEAAEQCGVGVIVIDRPQQESGYTMDEVEKLLLGEQTRRFPLFVGLTGKRCLVAGAGNIGTHRAEILRRYGAEVLVVSPEGEAPEGVKLERREYEPKDLWGVFLAVAATNDRAVNHRIAMDCKARSVPVSVADCRAECTFYFPALCEGDGITVGLVSDGTDHKRTSSTAKAIRELLQGGDDV